MAKRNRYESSSSSSSLAPAPKRLDIDTSYRAGTFRQRNDSAVSNASSSTAYQQQCVRCHACPECNPQAVCPKKRMAVASPTPPRSVTPPPADLRVQQPPLTPGTEGRERVKILNKIKENRWQELLCQLNVASVEDAEEKFPTVKGLIQLGIPGRDALRVYHQNTGSSLRELYDKVSNRRPCPAVVTMTDLTQREMDKWKRTRGHSPAPLSLSSRGASPLDETSDRSHSPVSHSSRSRASSEVPIPSIPLHLYRKPQSKKAPEPLFRKEDPSPSAYQSLCRPVRKSAQKAMELNARVNDIVDESDSDIEVVGGDLENDPDWDDDESQPFPSEVAPLERNSERIKIPRPVQAPVPVVPKPTPSTSSNAVVSRAQTTAIRICPSSTKSAAPSTSQPAHRSNEGAPYGVFNPNPDIQRFYDRIAKVIWADELDFVDSLHEVHYKHMLSSLYDLNTSLTKVHAGLEEVFKQIQSYLCCVPITYELIPEIFQLVEGRALGHNGVRVPFLSERREKSDSRRTTTNLEKRKQITTAWLDNILNVIHEVAVGTPHQYHIVGAFLRRTLTKFGIPEYLGSECNHAKFVRLHGWFVLAQFKEIVSSSEDCSLEEALQFVENALDKANLDKFHTDTVVYFPSDPPRLPEDGKEELVCSILRSIQGELFRVRHAVLVSLPSDEYRELANLLDHHMSSFWGIRDRAQQACVWAVILPVIGNFLEFFRRDGVTLPELSSAIAFELECWQKRIRNQAYRPLEEQDFSKEKRPRNLLPSTHGVVESPIEILMFLIMDQVYRVAKANERSRLPFREGAPGGDLDAATRNTWKQLLERLMEGVKWHSRSRSSVCNDVIAEVSSWEPQITQFFSGDQFNDFLNNFAECEVRLFVAMECGNSRSVLPSTLAPPETAIEVFLVEMISTVMKRLQKKDRLRGDHSVVLQDEDLKHVIRNYLRRWGADSEAVQNRILGNIEDTHGKLLSRVEDSSQRAVFVKYFILCLSSQKYCAGSFLENDLEEFADNCLSDLREELQNAVEGPNEVEEADTETERSSSPASEVSNFVLDMPPASLLSNFDEDSRSPHGYSLEQSPLLRLFLPTDTNL